MHQVSEGGPPPSPPHPVEIHEVSEDGRSVKVKLLGHEGTLNLSDAEMIRDAFKNLAAQMRERQERGSYQRW